MSGSGARWVVRDKARLLSTMMSVLGGNARMSFEGDLHGLGLAQIAGSSPEETAILKRNTLRPKQDFIVVPLASTTATQIWSAIGGSIPRRILHCQIESNGALEFGAYDNFHPDCIVFGGAVSRDVIDRLIAEGVLIPKRVGLSDKRH